LTRLVVIVCEFNGIISDDGENDKVDFNDITDAWFLLQWRRRSSMLHRRLRIARRLVFKQGERQMEGRERGMETLARGRSDWTGRYARRERCKTVRRGIREKEVVGL
jgi:hypothetical protein